MPQKRNGASRRTNSVTLRNKGRLVLPARLRERIDSAMGLYAHIAPGRDLVDELIRERRKEARDE